MVDFPGEAVRGRFVRLQVPSPQGIFFHLDEVEVYRAGDLKTNIALHRPADQSSASQWSTAKPSAKAPTSKSSAKAPMAFPTVEVIQGGRRLAAELRRWGVDTPPLRKRNGRGAGGAEGAAREHVAEVADRGRNARAPLPIDGKGDRRRQLYFRARWAVRRLALSNPLLDFDRLLIVKRFTQETMPDVCLNHMPWVSRPGGDLCVLSDWKDEGEAKVRPLLAGGSGPGHVHGMDLWWDGSRVVFGYAQVEDRPAGARLSRPAGP